MNRIEIVIEQEVQEDGTCTTTIKGERNYERCFTETFLSTDKPLGIHLHHKENIEGNNALTSASVVCLQSLLPTLKASMKIDGRVRSATATEQQIKFEMLFVPFLKRFERLAGIQLDFSRFKDEKEFRQYFKTLLR